MYYGSSSKKSKRFQFPHRWRQPFEVEIRRKSSFSSNVLKKEPTELVKLEREANLLREKICYLSRCLQCINPKLSIHQKYTKERKEDQNKLKEIKVLINKL